MEGLGRLLEEPRGRLLQAEASQSVITAPPGHVGYSQPTNPPYTMCGVQPAHKPTTHHV